MDNRVMSEYMGFPDRIYVVDVDGKIAYRGDPGPDGFVPEDAAAALATLLEEPSG
jgi:hypothetical protein